MPTETDGIEYREADRSNASRRRVVASRFALVRPLGEGGMGRVWLARDRVLERDVAIKTLRVDVIPHAAREQWMSMFAQEARSTAQLRHPGVLSLYDYGVDEGEPYLVLEFLRGTTLADMVAGGVLPDDRVLQLCRELAEALAHAHARGVVHRDLKPANIFIEADGRLKVMDFGIALLQQRVEATRVEVETALESEGTAIEFAGTAVESAGTAVAPFAMPRIAGTPMYMAPEQGRGDEQTAAVDVWAFGMVLAEMLTGAPPRDGIVPDAISSRWRPLVQACLQRDPSRRPSGGGELIEMLRDLQVTASEPVTLAPVEVEDPETLLVGREADVERVQAALTSGRRLVTVVGPAGVGKTSLATEVVRRERSRWDDVVVCALSEAEDATDLVQAVGAALGVALNPDAPLEQVGRALAARSQMLVVLENFEHLVAHVDVLSKWLRASSQTVFVATSQRRLGVAVEHPIVLDTLSLPDDDDPDSVSSSPAVQCLVALAERHGIELKPADDAAGIAELVRQLDGLPLAIALAAPRLRVMSPGDMCRRLKQRFKLLRARNADGDPRHLTLRAALADAWERIAPWEQAALMQCSVFVGSFELAAAEAVIDLDDFPDASFVMDILEGLVDRSLVQVASAPDAASDPRFTLLLSVQHFVAEEHAARTDEAARQAVRARHAAYFARYGEVAAYRARRRAADGGARDALVRDGQNVAAACRAAVELGDLELAAPLALALNDAVPASVSHAEAARIAELLLELSKQDGGASVWIRACALHIAWRAGKRALARELRASVMARLADLEPYQRGLAVHWAIVSDRNDPVDPVAIKVLRDTAEQARAAGDSWVLAISLIAMGMRSLYAGDLAASARYTGEAAVLAELVGSARLHGIALSVLALVAGHEGRDDDALALYERFASNVDLESGHTGLSNLAIAYNTAGRHGEALETASILIAKARRAGDIRGELDGLIETADASLALGNFDAAIEHAVSAVTLTEDTNPGRLRMFATLVAARAYSRRDGWDVAQSWFELVIDRLAPLYAADRAEAWCRIHEEAHRHGRREWTQRALAQLEAEVAEFDPPLPVCVELLSRARALDASSA